jgi:chemotaxis signal transduction protein/DNA-binding response OmpR family regulator
MTVERNITILLVEDSGTMRRMEVRILNTLGFTEVIEAHDGTKAVDILTTDQRVDLIISDWDMPNKNGYELLTWVRAHETRAQTPFIMATGRGEKSQAVVAREAGVSGMVQKPFSPHEMLSRIESVFSGESVSEAEVGKTRTPTVLPDGRVVLKVSHIQITDHIILGVLKHLIDKGELRPKTFALETVCMPSWNPVQRGIEHAETDGAFVLAPIAMDLFAYGVPIRLVLLAHKNGSILVRNKLSSGLAARESFLNKVVFVPHQLSVHHIVAHMYMTELGLQPGVAGQPGVNVAFEVVPPVKMPEFLSSNPNAAGFLVAEPLGTRSIASNIAVLEFLSGEAWPDHPCCVVTLRQEIIDQHPEVVQEFVNMLVQAGKFVEQRPGQTADFAVDFLDPQGQLGLTSSVIKNVLTDPGGITTGDLFPVIDDLNRMQEYMTTKMGIGTQIDLNTFVDTRFAETACQGIPRQTTSRLQAGSIVPRIQEVRTTAKATKVMLDREGKYLLFKVNDKGYGIGIREIREIIPLIPITSMPSLPSYFPGIINLRGGIIPVLDLGAWFGLEPTKRTDQTAIIVIESAHQGMKQVGMLVESVAEIVNIEAADVEPPSPAISSGTTQYILAMAKVKDQVIILMDFNRVVDGARNGKGYAVASAV